MKYVELNKDKRTLIDDEDFNYLNKFKWYITPKGYVIGKVGNKMILMHREILKAPPDLQVDHKNGDKLDNRKENLRFCTQSQNRANMDKYRKNTSTPRLYKGTVYRRDRKSWRAQIYIIGRNIRSGKCSSEVEAAIKYNELAVKHFGEFAKLNEICQKSPEGL